MALEAVCLSYKNTAIWAEILQLYGTSYFFVKIALTGQW
jgi:hypothetical protein